jgi:hypothetical protein
MPTKDRVLPLKLVKKNIIRIFNACNPKDDPDDLDFDVLEEGATFKENLLFIQNRHPEYTWYVMPAPKIEAIEKAREKEEARKEAERNDPKNMPVPVFPDEDLGETENMPNLIYPDEDEGAQKREYYLKVCEKEEEKSSLKEVERWHIEKTELGEVYSKKVLVKPHLTHTKGKERQYGRIQLTVNKSLIGKTVEIRIHIPKT